MIKESIDKNGQTKVNSFQLELLKRDFPQCFDKVGKFDIKAFENLIKTEEIDIKKEGYSLEFLGKSYAHLLASLDSETVIVPDKSNENSNSQNVYIVGDNLDALQHLKYSYSGQIKCIYIDPPYNTGSDGFVYNDKFEFTAEELAKKINIEEDEARRVLDMQGTSTHSAWLTFMYPRLELARNLLDEDGVIFISVDDNEQANCKLLCDSIFGENSYVTSIPRLTSAQRPSQEKYLSIQHDYVLVYVKNKDSENGFARTIKRNNLDEILEDGIGHYFQGDTSPILASATQGYSKNGDYDFEYNGKVYSPIASDGTRRRWLWTRERMNAAIKLGILVPTQNGIRVQNYIDMEFQEKTNIMAPKDSGLILASYDLINSVYANKHGTKSLKKLDLIFDFAKPVSLIKELIKLCHDKNAICLDFFSGSATTAQAVMELNAEDEGTRKFILVQLDEPVKKGSEAEKAGYKTIDEIGRERIRRAASDFAQENPEKAERMDLDFKTYYLKETDKYTLDKIVNFNPELPIDGEDIKSKFGKETVIETWKIKDGYGFNADVRKVDLKGYTAYLLSDSKVGTSLYLIEDMPEEAIIELVRKIEANELNLDRIIEYGYAFGYTSNTALRSNLKTLKNRTSISPVIRY